MSLPQERICPRCRSADVRRSRRRTRAEGFLRVIGILPYRCSSCFWRGYVRPARDGSFLVLPLSEQGLEKLFALAVRGLILVGAVAISLLAVTRMM